MNQVISTATGEVAITHVGDMISINTSDGERAFFGTQEAAVQHLAMALERERSGKFMKEFGDGVRKGVEQAIGSDGLSGFSMGKIE
jgi:hypothetical protein